MGKKHKKEKGKNDHPSEKKEKVEEEDESRYGGLPNRDLKKNLGCGG